MREIKIRQAWKNNETGIISYSYWTLDQLKKGINGVDNHVLVGEDQYTSRKDKNGKEIYEGDYCSGIYCAYLSLYVEMEGVVKFNKGCFYIERSSLLGYPLQYMKDDETEVIGNIYENPELMKETN